MRMNPFHQAPSPKRFTIPQHFQTEDQASCTQAFGGPTQTIAIVKIIIKKKNKARNLIIQTSWHCASIIINQAHGIGRTIINYNNGLKPRTWKWADKNVLKWLFTRMKKQFKKGGIAFKMVLAQISHPWKKNELQPKLHILCKNSLEMYHRLKHKTIRF